MAIVHHSCSLDIAGVTVVPWKQNPTAHDVPPTTRGSKVGAPPGIVSGEDSAVIGMVRHTAVPPAGVTPGRVTLQVTTFEFFMSFIRMNGST